MLTLRLRRRFSFLKKMCIVYVFRPLGFVLEKMAFCSKIQHNINVSKQLMQWWEQDFIVTAGIDAAMERPDKS